LSPDHKNKTDDCHSKDFNMISIGLDILTSFSDKGTVTKKGTAKLQTAYMF